MESRTYNERERLLSSDCDASGDPLISPNPKGSDSVSGLAKHRLLACQLLQNLWTLSV